MHLEGDKKKRYNHEREKRRGRVVGWRMKIHREKEGEWRRDTVEKEKSEGRGGGGRYSGRGREGKIKAEG